MQGYVEAICALGELIGAYKMKIEQLEEKVDRLLNAITESANERTV